MSASSHHPSESAASQGITRPLARYVVATQFDELPAAVRREAQRSGSVVRRTFRRCGTGRMCQVLPLPASKRAGRFPSASEATGIFDELPRPIQSDGVGRFAHFDRGISRSGVASVANEILPPGI
jgi:hypothetical protein